MSFKIVSSQKELIENKEGTLDEFIILLYEMTEEERLDVLLAEFKQVESISNKAK
jgi:hypothetical protein